MKKFQFRLEALLTLKESKKEKALEAYALALKKRQDLQIAYENKQNTFETLGSNIASARQQPFAPSTQLSFFQNYLRQKDSLEKQKQDLQTASTEEKSRLNEFIQKKKDCDVLAKLKGKKKQQYFADSLRAEEKQIEDIVNSRQARFKEH